MAYFHKQSKARLCFNMIKELKDSDGKRIVEQEEIKDHVFQHFKDLYRDKDEADPLAHAKILSGIPFLVTD